MTYMTTSLITREPLSDPAVSIAGGKPKRGVLLFYCPTSAFLEC